MDLLSDQRTTCLIKVIINPHAQESFTVGWKLYPQRKVNVKIITPNVQQLQSIVNEMKKELGPSKYAYNVNFNWKNVPKEIRQGTFKQEMHKLFQNAPAVDKFLAPNTKHPELDKEMLQNFAEIVKTYIQKFAANPEMDVRTPKNIKKIHNYVRSVCGKPHMTQNEALAIADLIV